MIELLRLMGPRWIAFRVVYAFRRKSGLLRLQTPMRPWRRTSEYEFVPCKIPQLQPYQPQAATVFASRILDGELCCFFRHWICTDFPPDWFRDPFSQATSIGSRQHWTRLSDAGELDIKTVWELSRFAFAFPLAQAFAITHDEWYADGFWTAVEDWRRNNPPNTGPNWMCGQEIAIRIIAWTHALGALKDAAASTPERLARLAQLIRCSAQRISANIGYALSQRNNHGTSEAAGIFTAGVVLGHKRWQARGLKLLDGLAKTLIYDDGSFSQHSVNYHRVMLDAYRWSIALADANEIRVSDEVRRRVELAETWLQTITDDISGHGPNLGGNDGAWILPLTGCDYRNYRETPVLRRDT